MSWTMIKSVFIFIFVERTLTSCNLRDFLNCLYKGRFIDSTFTIDTNSPASMFGKCRWILCRTQVFEWVKVGRILEPGVFFLICTSPPPRLSLTGERLTGENSPTSRAISTVACRDQNTSHNSKTLSRIQTTFGFWEVFLNSGTCFGS